MGKFAIAFATIILMIGTAYAQDAVNDTAVAKAVGMGKCPQNCKVGTPEHKNWWCSTFKDATSCEWPDDVNKIDCQWAVDKCVPK